MTALITTGAGLALEILLILLLLAFVGQIIMLGWRADRDEAQRMLDGAAADFARFEPAVRGAGEDEGGVHSATVTDGKR